MRVFLELDRFSKRISQNVEEGTAETDGSNGGAGPGLSGGHIRRVRRIKIQTRSQLLCRPEWFTAQARKALPSFTRSFLRGVSAAPPVRLLNCHADL